MNQNRNGGRLKREKSRKPKKAKKKKKPEGTHQMCDK